ncbi:hypothetical protein Tco_0446609 [Tanacetum coccineum]
MEIWFNGNDYYQKGYYIEGPNLNFFSVGQFCDADLEVTFGCIPDSNNPNPICLKDKQTSAQSMVIGIVRLFSFKLRSTSTCFQGINIVNGLPKLKIRPKIICVLLLAGESKKGKSFQLSYNGAFIRRLQFLHMDFCGSNAGRSINGKKYVL